MTNSENMGMKRIKKVKFFKYYGGKYHLLDDIMNEIIRIINEHDIRCVVDVFGGSGSVILSLPLEYKVNRIYNDLDKRLTTTLKILMDNEKREKLLQSLEYAVRSRDIFNEFKNSNWDDLTDDEIALRFLYLNVYSYRADNVTYGLITNTPRDYMSELINNIRNNFKYLRGLTSIENLDFRQVIKKYGGPKTLFYLDPPYLTNGDRYMFSFTKNDFMDLKNILETTNSKYILNNSDKDFDFMIDVFGPYTFVKEYKNHISKNRDTRLEGFWIKED